MFAENVVLAWESFHFLLLVNELFVLLILYLHAVYPTRNSAGLFAAMLKECFNVGFDAFR